MLKNVFKGKPSTWYIMRPSLPGKAYSKEGPYEKLQIAEMYRDGLLEGGVLICTDSKVHLNSKNPDSNALVKSSQWIRFNDLPAESKRKVLCELEPDTPSEPDKELEYDEQYDQNDIASIENSDGDDEKDKELSLTNSDENMNAELKEQAENAKKESLNSEELEEVLSLGRNSGDNEVLSKQKVLEDEYDNASELAPPAPQLNLSSLSNASLSHTIEQVQENNSKVAPPPPPPQSTQSRAQEKSSSHPPPPPPPPLSGLAPIENPVGSGTLPPPPPPPPQQSSNDSNVKYSTESSLGPTPPLDPLPAAIDSSSSNRASIPPPPPPPPKLGSNLNTSVPSPVFPPPPPPPHPSQLGLQTTSTVPSSGAPPPPPPPPPPNPL